MIFFLSWLLSLQVPIFAGSDSKITDQNATIPPIAPNSDKKLTEMSTGADQKKAQIKLGDCLFELKIIEKETSKALESSAAASVTGTLAVSEAMMQLASATALVDELRKQLSKEQEKTRMAQRDQHFAKRDAKEHHQSLMDIIQRKDAEIAHLNKEIGLKTREIEARDRVKNFTVR